MSSRVVALRAMRAALVMVAGCAIPAGIARDPDPDLDSLPVAPSDDSAVVTVPPVEGARDYRAFAITDGVEVSTDADGRETVTGATIFCAGQRQRAAPALPVPEVVDRIEITGLTEPTTFVIEAIDRLCPFPGLFGPVDDEFEVTSPDAMVSFPELVRPVPISSEATIRARYGSMIVNGQGPARELGQPADPNPPVVLRRWEVRVAPAPAQRTATFFSDFVDEDPPALVPGGDLSDGSGRFMAPPGRGFSVAVLQSSRFDFYATNAEAVLESHAFFDRGQLHTLVPDIAQSVSATVMAVPRTLAHLPDDEGAYLHVTFETASDSTNRRHWWVGLCGSETPGGTFAPSGLLADYIIAARGFFLPDAPNPSVAGWNCLFVLPYDGLPLPDGSQAQSSVIVAIHRANRPDGESAVNVSPEQAGPSTPRAWYRRIRGGVATELGMLDDAIDMAPRARFDLYVSRGRLVMYVNGEQRLCNDFGPERLTMAEAAVSFSDLLDHSSAEHGEMMLDFADRTGQLHYLNNTIFANAKTWDNVGFEEDVSLPDGFVEADCYVHAP